MCSGNRTATHYCSYNKTLALLLLSLSACLAMASSSFAADGGNRRGVRQGETFHADGKAISYVLSIAMDGAIVSLAQPDGYYRNAAVKIRLPDRIRRIGEILRDIGDGKEVNDFIMSMNRAAEHAIQRAGPAFRLLVREMLSQDQVTLQAGAETPATDYFQANAYGGLYAMVKRQIGDTMQEWRVATSYEGMMAKYALYPFKRIEDPDLLYFVTEKALNGLFQMLAAEEQGLRWNWKLTPKNGEAEDEAETEE